MTEPSSAWGARPSARYEVIAARFRPLFDRIRTGAIERETTRTLPFEQIAWLRQAGFGALRVPESHGGAGLTLPEFFALLIELSAADSNLTQSLRNHFGFAEEIVGSHHGAHRDRWLRRLAEGAILGGAWTETVGTKVGSSATVVRKSGDTYRLTGTKYYSTGSLYADWIDVAAVDEAGEDVSVIVAVKATGVEIIDDWNGFGQTLTASGTAVFRDSPVEGDDIVRASTRFPYAPSFFQVVHLATLTGIARAAATEVALAVRARERTYSHASAPRSSRDPQILQVVGHVHSNAYAAGAITLNAAGIVQQAYEARFASLAEAEAFAINVAAEIEIAQAQTAITSLVLEATSSLFDSLGASATNRAQSLDRFWRNARTISSHNPRIYKDRIVGDYAVNRTDPPFQWKIGQILDDGLAAAAE